MGGVALAEKLRRMVEGERFDHEGKQVPVTISLGVAAFSTEFASSAELYKAADDRLYEAKRSGRNLVR